MDLFLDTNYNHRIFTFQSARIFLSRQQTRLLFLYWNCRDWSYQSKSFVFGWQFVVGQTGLHHLIVWNSKIVLFFSHQSVIYWMWSENGGGLGVSVNLWLEKWRHCSLCEVLVLWMGLKGFGSNALITWSSGMCKCNYIKFLNISIAISLNVIGRLMAKLFSNEKRPMLNINVTNWSDKCNRPEHFLFRSMSVAFF